MFFISWIFLKKNSIPIFISLCVSATPAFSQSLGDLLPNLLKTHDKVISSQNDLDSARFGIDRAKAAYLPSLNITSDLGYEHQQKPTGTANTSTGFHQVSLKSKQLIWDFGKTTQTVNRSRLSAQKAELTLKDTKQALILQAVTAYLNIMRASDNLRFALQTEANIKRQTGIEKALVKRNSGTASDVLQAKSSLAGAIAQRIGAESALVKTKNRFRSIFRMDVGDVLKLLRPNVPMDRLPGNIDEAINIALQSNFTIRKAQLDVEIAKKTSKINKATLYAPSLDFSGDIIYKENVGGTLNTKIEKIAKVSASFPLYSGGRDAAVYYGSLKIVGSKARVLADLRHTLEEKVRNAWQDLKSKTLIAQFRRNQANIASEFLEVARTERKLKKRSLVSILSKETSFLSAMNAAISAQTDTALAVYDLLATMNTLDVDIFVASSSSPNQ